MSASSADIFYASNGAWQAKGRNLCFQGGRLQWLPPIVKIAPFIVVLTLVLALGRVAIAADDAKLVGRDASQNQAAQVAHLLEYVSADYPAAIAVGDEKELAEQLEVLAEAARLADKLKAPSKGFAPSEAVRSVIRLVESRRPVSEVSAASKSTVAQLVAYYDLVQAPRTPPSHERGKRLYEQHCSPCHGLGGHADTERAQQYSPRPANFHAPEVARSLSPLRASRVVRYGVPNTAMAPFDFLSDEERWDLAFYVNELDHVAPAGATRGVRMFGLADLAAESDDELRADLASAGVKPNDVEAALSDLRLHAPYDSAVVNAVGASGMALRARAGFRKVSLLLLRGDHEAARAMLLSVYLDDVEPIEAALRAADPALVNEVELAYKEVRAEIESGAIGSTASQKLDALALDMGRASALLEGNGAGRSFWGTVLASAGIALREGVEAALLIAALLAVVVKAGSPDRKRWVHAGWISAAVAGAATWLVTRRLVEMSGLGRETFEGIAALLASLVLFYVSYWLFAKREAARWVSYLRTKAKVEGAAISLFGISFIAVYREGVETVIFYQALVAQPDAGPAAGLGAALGLLLLVLLVLAYGRAGKFAPPQSFFAFSSLLLYSLAVVFAGQGIAALQTTGLVPLHPASLPYLPALGVYPTIETYAVQGGLIGLALTALFVMRSHRAPPASPGAPGNPVSGTREGAKL
jgi:high-affinity iron transporter